MNKKIIKRPIGWGSYCNMKARCLDKNRPEYFRYGGRGIKICDRWLDSFKNFVEDMGIPNKGQTLDRIDNNGNYCVENCKWSSMREQSNNRRSNHLLTFKGRTQTICQWADEFGIKRTTLMMRINSYEWTIDEALS